MSHISLSRLTAFSYSLKSCVLVKPGSQAEEGTPGAPGHAACRLFSAAGIGSALRQSFSMTLGTCSSRALEGLQWRNGMNLVQKQCNDSCCHYVSFHKEFLSLTFKGRNRGWVCLYGRILYSPKRSEQKSAYKLMCASWERDREEDKKSCENIEQDN